MTVTVNSLDERLAALAGPLLGHDTGVADADGEVHREFVLEDGGRFHHVQRFEAGRLVAWERADGGSPWAVVEPVAGEEAPFLPSPDFLTWEQLAAAGIRTGGTTAPFPPLDEWDLGDFSALPAVAGGELVLRFETVDHPLAPMRAEIRFVDARPAERRLVTDWTEVEGTLAHVGMPWRSYVQWRAGEVNVLEAVESGGTVDARWTVLLLIHGIVQQPEWTSEYRRLPAIPADLRWWGPAQRSLALAAASD